MTITDEQAKAFWLKTDWSRPNKPATEAEIVASEDHIGHKLPASFRALLKQQSGGVADFDAYDDGEEFFPLMPLFGVDPAAAADTIICAFDPVIRETFNVPDGVVLLGGQGHTWLGLDYRSDSAQPSVVFRHHEEARIETVAPDFDGFLAGLVEDLDEE